MNNKKIEIIVKGDIGSGKTTISCLLEHYLKLYGYNIEFKTYSKVGYLVSTLQNVLSLVKYSGQNRKVIIYDGEMNDQK